MELDYKHLLAALAACKGDHLPKTEKPYTSNLETNPQLENPNSVRVPRRPESII